MWKNFLIKRIVRAFQPFQKEGNPNHFLIISTTGLGDTLWGTPAIRALRETYPTAYIGCLTSPLGADVLKNNPHINEFFVVKNFFSLLTLFSHLKKKRIGTALFFHTSQRAPLPFCAALGIGRRIGTEGLQKGMDDLLTDRIVWQSGHEIERRLAIVKAAGAKPSSSHLDFFIQEEDRIAAQHLVPETFVIGLHPGAKDRFKQWPVDHFIRVGQRLQKEVGCTVVVTGSPAEKKLIDSICEQIEGSRPVIKPLHQMAAILERLSLFVTNDTGPLHLALAMNTKVLPLFTPTNPIICGPYQTHTHVLQAGPTCFPCLKKKCQDAFCMRQIGPEDVFSAALQQLGQKT